MDYGTEAESAEWAAVVAASVTPPEHGPLGDAPVLPVDRLPPASGWQQQPAWGGRPKMYPIHTRVGRGRGTLALGTPVPSRAGTVLLYSDRPPLFPRGGAPTPPGGGGAGTSDLTPAPRRRGACSFCGHLGHWVWECPAESPEVRAHGRALREAVAAHRSGRGPAPPPPLPLGAGRRSRLRRRVWPPPGPLRRVPSRSSTPWKPTTGPTRTAQPTTTGAPPRSGPRGRMTVGAPATPRETRKGQPLEWAAHGRCPPQGTPALLHHGEPPASGPQAAGRSGFPAGARLLPSGPGTARGGSTAHRPGARTWPLSRRCPRTVRAPRR